jgi:hypothetical protein
MAGIEIHHRNAHSEDAARNAAFASSRLSATPPFGPCVGYPIWVHCHSSRSVAIPAADGLAVVADFVILRVALVVEEDGLSVSPPPQAPQAFWTSSHPITAIGEPSGLMRSDS